MHIKSMIEILYIIVFLVFLCFFAPRRNKNISDEKFRDINTAFVLLLILLLLFYVIIFKGVF